MTDHDQLKVIHHEPSSWFFLTNRDEYFIDVNCSYSFLSFSGLLKLNDAEIAKFHLKGKEYLNSLAADIQHYALSKYKDRNVSDNTKDIVYKAIMEFKSQK